MEISPRAINAILGMLGVQIQPEQIQAVIEILQVKLPEVINDYQALSERTQRIEAKLDRLSFALLDITMALCQENNKVDQLLASAALQRTDIQDVLNG